MTAGDGGFWAGSLAYDGTPGRASLVRLDPCVDRAPTWRFAG
jgi:hypothetical protein